jgi:hypothetical protein
MSFRLWRETLERERTPKQQNLSLWKRRKDNSVYFPSLFVEPPLNHFAFFGNVWIKGINLIGVNIKDVREIVPRNMMSLSNQRATKKKYNKQREDSFFHNNIKIYSVVIVFVTRPLYPPAGIGTWETKVYIGSLASSSSLRRRLSLTRTRRGVLRIPRDHKNWFSETSIRTSFVPISLRANSRMALIALGVLFLKELRNKKIQCQKKIELSWCSMKIRFCFWV